MTAMIDTTTFRTESITAANKGFGTAASLTYCDSSSLNRHTDIEKHPDNTSLTDLRTLLRTEFSSQLQF